MSVNAPNPDLLRALGAERGIVCAIGAGGKKTTLYRLAQAHPGRVGITATVFTTAYPDELAAQTLLMPGAELLRQVPTAAGPRIAYAQPSAKPGRLAGLEIEHIAAIHRSGNFDLTLVKADGARMRQIKCPAEHEPNLPGATDTVLLMLSALALGQPLTDQLAHRPERIGAVTGRAVGERITAGDLARIYTHPQGLLQGTAGLRVIPVLNMVDSAELERSGRQVANLALQACPRFDRFILTSARHPGYLRALIER